jgi:hypothetical protein
LSLNLFTLMLSTSITHIMYRNSVHNNGETLTSQLSVAGVTRPMQPLVSLNIIFFSLDPKRSCWQRYA